MSQPGEEPGDITRLQRGIRGGDPRAEDELLGLVYNQLRSRAAHLMRAERPDHSLQATELVHEAFVRLMRSSNAIDWQDRTHFFAIAARQMRRVLVDHARSASHDLPGAGNH